MLILPEIKSIKNQFVQYLFNALPIVLLTWQSLALTFLYLSSQRTQQTSMKPNNSTANASDSRGAWLKNKPIEEDLPVIFIGGRMRSGTTLTAVLDALPSISCGRESVLIPKILIWLSHKVNILNWSSEDRLTRGLTRENFGAAVKAFITSILYTGITVSDIKNPGFRPCKKDPYTTLFARYLAQLYPKSKFVLLIRDGRDVAQSRVTHNFAGDWFSYNRALSLWNEELSFMIAECKLVGPQRCYPLFYEQLVLNTVPNLKALLSFLGQPWHDNILKHHTIVAQKYNANDTTDGWVDTVSHAVHENAVGHWITYLHQNPGENIDLSLAPLISELGYGSVQNAEDYRNLKQVDLEATSLVLINRLFWNAKN